MTAALLIGLAPAAVAAEEAQTPVLTWQDCQDGFQCATARVPLDYDQPSGTKIDLAMIRLPATDPAKRIGSLFVNFGGPGASGVDRLRGRGKWEWLFSPELRARFDVVSWDPRGIGRSATVRCFDSVEEQQSFLNSIPVYPGKPRRNRRSTRGTGSSSGGARRSPAICWTTCRPQTRHVTSTCCARRSATRS